MCVGVCACVCGKCHVTVNTDVAACRRLSVGVSGLPQGGGALAQGAAWAWWEPRRPDLRPAVSLLWVTAQRCSDCIHIDVKLRFQAWKLSEDKFYFFSC